MPELLALLASFALTGLVACAGAQHPAPIAENLRAWVRSTRTARADRRELCN